MSCACQALVRSLEAALASPSIPADLVTSLLNLAEFMEHDDKSLPLDTRCAPAALAEQPWLNFRATSVLKSEQEAPEQPSPCHGLFGLMATRQ